MEEARNKFDIQSNTVQNWLLETTLSVKCRIACPGPITLLWIQEELEDELDDMSTGYIIFFKQLTTDKKRELYFQIMYNFFRNSKRPITLNRISYKNLPPDLRKFTLYFLLTNACDFSKL